MGELKPRCRRTAGSLQQLRYQVPYDITSSVLYPLTSSNGSTIIICGHSTGLFIIWRGGRQLKSTKVLPDPTAGRDVMTIDDSDDESPETEPPTAPEFESAEEEFDPRNPYPPIVQTLDLPLGTGVLHLTAPQLSEVERRHLRPRLLRDRMLLAVACTDSSVRAVTLPLDPPSEVSKLRTTLVQNPALATAGNGSWGEQIVAPPLSQNHRTLPTAVSVTTALRYLIVDSEDEDMEGDLQQESDSWDLLLASGSTDAGGTLLVHRIPIEADGRRLAEGAIEIWRNVLLENVPAALDIHAGIDAAATSYPKVLVAEANGPVRVYGGSSEETRDEGQWLASLQPSLDSLTDVISVKFGLAGRLVMALTREGQWGVWDLHDLSESSSKGTIATLSRYGYGGTLASTPQISSNLKPTSRPTEINSLPAVTPHTRKVRQKELFTKYETRPTVGNNTSPATSRGKITLSKTSHESGTGEDCSVLIWHNDTAIFIQSLRAHHANRRASSGAEASSALIAAEDPFSVTSNSGAQIKVLVVPDQVTLNGGIRVAVYPWPHYAGRAPTVRSKAPAAVYVSERAVSFVGPPRTEDAAEKSQRNGASHSSSNKDRSAAGSDLAGLLKRGELSLDGVEGLLDRMAGGVERISGRA